MSTDPNIEDVDSSLLATVRIDERPFTSDVPVLGPLIVSFRNAWNSVAAKWYIRPLVAQQNAFNKAAVDQMAALEARRHQNEALLAQLEGRLAEQDREQSELTRDMGELTARIIQLRRQLDATRSGKDIQT